MNFATLTSDLTRSSRTAFWVSCLLAGTLGVAQAGTPDKVSDDVPSVVVNYSDLNLATAAGAHTLYTRIARAAHDVCPFEDSKVPSQVIYNHECRAAAIARAVREVNSPQLAALSAGNARRG